MHCFIPNYLGCRTISSSHVAQKSFEGAWRLVSTDSPHSKCGLPRYCPSTNVQDVHRYSQVLIINYSIMGPLLLASRAAVHYPACQNFETQISKFETLDIIPQRCFDHNRTSY